MRPRQKRHAKASDPNIHKQATRGCAESRTTRSRVLNCDTYIHPVNLIQHFMNICTAVEEAEVGTLDIGIVVVVGVGIAWEVAVKSRTVSDMR